MCYYLSILIEELIILTLTTQQFISRLAPFAIADMLETKVPASLTIAQGILESANGNSSLTVEANNLFGMKGTGTAGSVRFPTKEFVNNEWVTVKADFRKYNNWGESVADHSKLLVNGVSWNRNFYSAVIGKDGITAAKEIAKAGYATDPDYSNKLIKLMQENNLLQYDKQKENPIITESAKFIELEEIVKKIIIGLTQVSDKLAEIPAPDWFVKEFPNALELINQNSGTNDFWRAFAVCLRIMQKQK